MAGLAILLDEAAALEGGEESAHRGLVQIEGVGEVSDRGGAIGFREAD
jgi:hypothetical protein